MLAEEWMGVMVDTVRWQGLVEEVMDLRAWSGHWIRKYLTRIESSTCNIFEIKTAFFFLLIVCFNCFLAEIMYSNQSLKPIDYNRLKKGTISNLRFIFTHTPHSQSINNSCLFVDCGLLFTRFQTSVGTFLFIY